MLIHEVYYYQAISGYNLIGVHGYFFIHQPTFYSGEEGRLKVPVGTEVITDFHQWFDD